MALTRKELEEITREFFCAQQKMKKDLDTMLFGDYNSNQVDTSGTGIMLRNYMALSKNAFKNMVEQLRSMRAGNPHPLPDDFYTASTVQLDEQCYYHKGPGSEADEFINMMGAIGDESQCVARSMEILYGKNDGNSDE